MHGNHNMVKTPAKKQPKKGKEKYLKYIRKAQRGCKNYIKKMSQV